MTSQSPMQRLRKAFKLLQKSPSIEAAIEVQAAKHALAVWKAENIKAVTDE